MSGISVVSGGMVIGMGPSQCAGLCGNTAKNS